MRTVSVVEYDPDWPAEFEREAARLAQIFGDEVIAIHHIGSTAVPGLAAKPIIDLMPLVRDIERVDRYNPGMAAVGYEARGEYGIAGRRYFSKGGDERTHHVHIYEPGNPEVRRHLDFRDYLRAHPDVARQYAELKMLLACQFPHDPTAYTQGKDAFVEKTDRLAAEWRR